MTDEERDKEMLFRALTCRPLGLDELARAAAFGAELNIQSGEPYNLLERLAQLSLAWQIQATLRMACHL